MKSQHSQQTEASLRQREERLRLALEAAQIGVWDWDIVGEQVDWFHDQEQLFGLASGTFHGTCQTFLKYVHPEDRERITQTITQALETKTDYDEEFRVIWPDGSLHWLCVKGRVFYDDADRAIRMLGTAIEVTVRKQVELALKLQTDRERLVSMITRRIRQSLNLDEILNTTVAEVRQFLQTNRVIIYRFNSDRSGQVIAESVTTEWISLLGLTFPKPKTSQYSDHHSQGKVTAIEDVETAGLDPVYVDLFRQQQVRATLVVPILQGNQLWGLLAAHHCSGPRPWHEWEVDLLQQLATHLAIALQQASLFNQVQQLNTNLETQVQERTAQLQQALGFETVLKRITDKVRDTLDEQQILPIAVRELAQALNVYSCSAAIYDLEQRTATIYYEHSLSTPASQGRVLSMTSYPEIYNQLLQGQCFQFCSIIPNPMQGRAAMLTCPIFDNKGAMGDLWLMHRPDYAFNNLEVRLMQQVANQCAIAIRQARLYQAAQAQVQSLERLNQLKDDFLSTVSHELRTPIANMKMAIQMLKLAPSLERGKRYLEILQTECNRETELINDLLDLQRLETISYPTFLAESVKLADWLPTIIEPFQSRMQERKQHLQVEIAPELPPLVSDLSSLERLLSELLNNACKYTPPEKHITVRAFAENAQIHIQIRNTGIEIPEREQPRIFDKFYRIPSADPWKQGGTGLGLALVKKLVDRLEGNIYVSSAADETTFTIELPLALLNRPPKTPDDSDIVLPDAPPQDDSSAGL